MGSDVRRRLTAIAATVDMNKRDAEIKLILGCNEEEIKAIEIFHNSRYMSAVIFKRDE